MEGKMKVAVMEGIGKMGFTERPIPTPKDDEVLVKLEYVGICGSDLHYYEHGRIGDYIVEPPFVLGHEPGGTVVEVGKDVKHLKVGDRVALEPGKTCGHCEFCKTGRYNLCPDVIFFATPPVDGVFQEYVAHEADLCFKLPDNVDTMEGALIEPLAVGFHAAKQGGAAMGQTAVVTGSGCIGLVTMMALKALGVDQVYVVDIMQTEICVKQGMEALVKGGTQVLVGYSASGNMNLPTSLICDKEISIKSVFRYRHIYPLAIQAVAEGKVNLKGIVTNIFELDDIQNAMDRSVNEKADIVKSVVKIC